MSGAHLKPPSADTSSSCSYPNRLSHGPPVLAGPALYRNGEVHHRFLKSGQGFRADYSPNPTAASNPCPYGLDMGTEGSRPPGGANTRLMYFPGMFPRASTRERPLRCQRRRSLEEIPMRFSRIRLIVTLVLGLLAAPYASAAPAPTKVPRIGVLSQFAPPAKPSAAFEGFRAGLRELGYLEGRNVTLEYRYAEGKYERLASPRACHQALRRPAPPPSWAQPRIGWRGLPRAPMSKGAPMRRRALTRLVVCTHVSTARAPTMTGRLVL